jgi:hypothetical protein
VLKADWLAAGSQEYPEGIFVMIRTNNESNVITVHGVKEPCSTYVGLLEVRQLAKYWSTLPFFNMLCAPMSGREALKQTYGMADKSNTIPITPETFQPKSRKQSLPPVGPKAQTRSWRRLCQGCHLRTMLNNRNPVTIATPKEASGADGDL